LLDSPARHSFSLRVSSPIPAAPALMPGRAPKPGEQYRFHFDMAKCIGCKCCVVACNEQNGNPAEINWRRVGEIEGGIYPEAQRWHLSMGCNHCLEPSCLIGCPVEAYTKDPLTGIVDHDPDICIGCQYCTWNCSYGVPQYNPERGVVGKCDMCHGRLEQGLMPACVNACPEEAIAIAPLHLGRPIHAWRAIKNWRRSWLSREVLLLSLFAGGAACFAVAPSVPWLGGVTFFCGLIAIMASARIYMVPARPAWNLP